MLLKVTNLLIHLRLICMTRRSTVNLMKLTVEISQTSE